MWYQFQCEMNSRERERERERARARERGRGIAHDSCFGSFWGYSSPHMLEFGDIWCIGVAFYRHFIVYYWPLVSHVKRLVKPLGKYTNWASQGIAVLTFPCKKWVVAGHVVELASHVS